jgi:hypothetical protein
MLRGQQQLGLVPVMLSPFELELLADTRYTLERMQLFASYALGVESTPLDLQTLLLARITGIHGARCEVPR